MSGYQPPALFSSGFLSSAPAAGAALPFAGSVAAGWSPAGWAAAGGFFLPHPATVRSEAVVTKTIMSLRMGGRSIR